MRGGVGCVSRRAPRETCVRATPTAGMPVGKPVDKPVGKPAGKPVDSRPSYRIRKRAPATRAVCVRLTPGGDIATLRYVGGDAERRAAVRAHAAAAAGVLLATVRLVRSTLVREVGGRAVVCGGPGLARELLAEQLADGADVWAEGDTRCAHPARDTHLHTHTHRHTPGKKKECVAW